MSDEWAVIGTDAIGVTVEWTGDPQRMPDWIARAAQQEVERWPTLEPTIYTLIPPDQVPAARAQEAESARVTCEGCGESNDHCTCPKETEES